MTNGLIYSIACKEIEEAQDVDYSLNLLKVLNKITLGDLPHTLTKDDFIIHQAYFDLNFGIHRVKILFTNAATGQILGSLNISVDLHEGQRRSAAYAPPKIDVHEQMILLIQVFWDDILVNVYPLQLD